MDTNRLLNELTDEELIEVSDALPTELERRGLGAFVLPSAVSVESATEAKVDISEVKEAILGQLITAHAGYQDITRGLNMSRSHRDWGHITIARPETLATELGIWLTTEKVVYVAEAMEADPELRFSLIATPNDTARDDEIIALARYFGKGQPHETKVWSNVYKIHYKWGELSGKATRDRQRIKFRLIPSKLTPDMSGTAEQQRAKLAELQKKYPYLSVQSVLEDITYWRTLRAQGDSLTSGAIYERTYSRHFDLPEHRLDWFDYLPQTFIDDNGQPVLGGSDAQLDGYARLSVG